MWFYSADKLLVIMINYLLSFRLCPSLNTTINILCLLLLGWSVGLLTQLLVLIFDQYHKFLPRGQYDFLRHWLDYSKSSLPGVAIALLLGHKPVETNLLTQLKIYRPYGSSSTPFRLGSFR